MFSLAGSAWQRGSALAVYHVAIAAALLHLAAASRMLCRIVVSCTMSYLLRSHTKSTIIVLCSQAS
jgi:hypothetical protein